MAGELHPALFKAYVARFPEKKKADCQKESDQFWKDSKKRFGKDKTAFEQCVRDKIQSLQQGTVIQKTTTILSFLKQTKKQVSVFS